MRYENTEPESFTDRRNDIQDQLREDALEAMFEREQMRQDVDWTEGLDLECDDDEEDYDVKHCELVSNACMGKQYIEFEDGDLK